MSFSSLKNVLLSDREDQQLVSFSTEETVCWAQLLSDIKALSLKLRNSDKKNWAICCENSYLFCTAFFAAVYADKNIVLPGNHQPAMLLSLAEHFDAVVHDGLVAADFSKQQLTLPCTDRHPGCALPFTELDLQQVNITLFTSGSSGLPKAVNKSLLMLDNEITQLELVWGELLDGCSIVSTVSHQHIYGLLFRILWPLCAGRAFQSNDLVYPEQVLTGADNNCCLISSPALLKRLPQDKQSSAYRAVFSSGGPLNNEAAEQCKALFDQYPFEVFGSTETGGIGYRQQQQADTAWNFFPGISARLVELGCLSLKSPWIDPQTWYQTSDQCELLENNQFILKGRVDRIVKIEEKRISLVEVEQRLNQLEWIDESVVLVIDDIHRLSLGAVIKLSAQGEHTMQALGKGKFWIKLRQALRLWIEPVAIPRHYRIAAEIPVNKQGKRLHSEISQLFENEKFSKESGIKNVST
ncbi:AMP-binding protein [Psychromonas aquimarina]|uniref:AMP-binding protein n=1 Tax=Psychromonas aquimarina TaxID=444919 RepID=UPI0004062268|nr:AMP-binding protein [Psychromonas aquimarina]